MAYPIAVSVIRPYTSAPPKRPRAPIPSASSDTQFLSIAHAFS